MCNYVGIECGYLLAMPTSCMLCPFHALKAGANVMRILSVPTFSATLHKTHLVTQTISAAPEF